MRVRASWVVRCSVYVAGLVSCGGDPAEPPPDPVAEQDAVLPSAGMAGASAGGAGGSAGAGGTEAMAGAASLPACREDAEEAQASCTPLEMPPVAARCGDGVVNQPSEQCDGTVPATAPSGTTCSVRCTIEQPYAPNCGNGIIDLLEQCDGNVLPAGVPAGSGCSALCTVVPPDERDCGSCAQRNCSTQRADLDASLPAAQPLIECVLGPNWQAGGRAAQESCGNGELFGACYCGTLPVLDCSSSSAAAVDGPCSAQILGASGCDAAASDSLCPLVNFLDPANLNGKVMQFVQCQQDFCFEQCFNL